MNRNLRPGHKVRYLHLDLTSFGYDEKKNSASAFIHALRVICRSDCNIQYRHV